MISDQKGPLERDCLNCRQPLPQGVERCPACGTLVRVERVLFASERGVVAGGDILAPVFTGDIGGNVTVQVVELPGVLDPPIPDRPPEVGHFVGREEELAEYAGRLQTSHFAIITGMAGVGKTALAARLAQRAADPNRIFWHSFHEGEGINAVLWELAGFLAWLGEKDAWAMIQNARGTAGGRVPPPEMIFNYLLQTLRGRGVLICLDDYQFVDQDPLQNRFVEEMAQAIRAGEIDLIVTSRRMPDFARSLEFPPLQGLNLADTRQLLASRQVDLPEDQVLKLYVATGGNAEFLTLSALMLAKARDRAQLITRIGEMENIEEYLIEEVHAGLSAAQQAVMVAVSIFMGYPGTRSAIEAVLDGEEGGGMQAEDIPVRSVLHELAEQYLLVRAEGEAGRLYSQHAIVQAFYYEQPSRRKRQAMHRRAGGYYLTEEPDLLKAALHYERGGEPAQAAQLATTDVWILINEGRAKPLEELLKRFEGADLDAQLRAQVQLARGQVSAILDEREAARQHYAAALAGLEALGEDPIRLSLEARACLGMAELLEYEDPQEALGWVKRGLGSVEGLRTPEEAELNLKAGTILMDMGDYPAALEALERALPLLPPGPSQLSSRAGMALGGVYYLQGDVERGKKYTLEALQISRQLRDHFQTVNNLTNLGVLKYTHDDWQGGIQDFREALELAERLSSEKLTSMLKVNLGAAYINTGQDEAARENLMGGLALARKHQLHLYEIMAQYRLADLALRGGEWQAAEGSLGESERLAIETDFRGPLIAIYAARAEVDLALGKAGAALENARRAVALAEELGEELARGECLRTLGKALLADGKPDEAIQALQESLALLEGEDNYEAARTRRELGAALTAAGQPEQSRQALVEALAAFERLGAERDGRELRELLKKE